MGLALVAHLLCARPLLCFPQVLSALTDRELHFTGGETDARVGTVPAGDSSPCSLECSPAFAYGLLGVRRDMFICRDATYSNASAST